MKIKILVKRLIIILLALGAVGASAKFLFFPSKKAPSYQFIIAAKADLSQEVSVTGHVKSTNNVELAFERSGRIAAVTVAIGDTVVTNQELIQMDDRELQADFAQRSAAVESATAQLQQYQAALATQHAKYDELKRGARPEEIQVAQTKADNAKKTLNDDEIALHDVEQNAEIILANYYRDVVDTLNNAYTKAESSVRVKPALLYSGNKSTGYDLTYSTCDTQAETDATFKRYRVELDLDQWKLDLAKLSTVSTRDELDAALLSAMPHLTKVRSFLNRTSDTLIIGCGLDLDTIETYRTNLNAGLASMDTADASVNAKQQSIAAQKITNQKNINSAEATVNTAKNTLATAESELALKLAGTAPEQISAQAAQVRQAEANVASQHAQIKQAEANVVSIISQLEKTILRAPIDGIVTVFDAKVGEIVTAGNPIVSLISQTKYEIIANVTEADIAKIEVKKTATVTLDAYGDDVNFPATVSKIDPGETIIEGIPTYKVTLQFLEADARIKPGMTANVDILTAERHGIIAIPQRAIIIKN